MKEYHLNKCSISYKGKYIDKSIRRKSYDNLIEISSINAYSSVNICKSFIECTQHFELSTIPGRLNVCHGLDDNDNTLKKIGIIERSNYEVF